jgi:osmoprotectant transport system permease protein
MGESLSSFWEFFDKNINNGNFMEALIRHATYVVTVTITATIIAVAVGVLVRRRPVAREVALGTTSVFITIPSLALFTLFIPVLGLGFAPAFVALLLYALLPIMRNTVTGLNSVSPEVLESAKGMGMSSTERLFKVELPLAWPVIITGIRVSALLTTGIAAIATLIAGGGFGDFIKVGLTRLGLPNSLEAIWLGTLGTIALGLTFDLMFVLARRFTTPRGIR